MRPPSFRPRWLLRLPFDHPLWILYSSGTTGLTKAILHGHGGVVLSGCAGSLHNDVGPSYSDNNFGDATINRHDLRLGTSEIHDMVEKFPGSSIRC